MPTMMIISLLSVAWPAVAATPTATLDSGRCEAKPFTLKKPAQKPIAAELKVASAEPVKAPAPKPKPKPKIEIGCKLPK